MPRPLERIRSRAVRVVLLVVPVASVLVGVELALLSGRTSMSLVLGIGLLVLGTSGVIALIASAVREPRTLALLLLGPPVALALPTLEEATARATTFWPVLNTVLAAPVAALAGAASALATHRLLRDRAPSLQRLRHFVVTAAGIAAALAVFPPLHAARNVAPRVVVLGVVVVAAALVARDRRPWPAWLGAVAAAAAACLVPTPYPTGRSAAGVAALTWATVAMLRHYQGWVDRSDARRSRADAALALVTVGLLILAERTITPVAGRFGTASRGGLAVSVVRLARSLTDVDGDGFGHAFGQRDCAPLDPAVHPGRHEIPGNAIDENCLAGAAPPGPVAWIRSQEAVHPRPPERRGDVLIVSVDALRHDHTLDPALPNLRRLAAEGLEFERTYATSTLTAHALPGLLAGHLPTWRSYDYPSPFSPVPDRPVEGVGTALGRLGYDTAFAGGFEEPNNPTFMPRSSGTGFRTMKYTLYAATPAETVAAAEEAFASLDATRPRLLWVHFMWLHHEGARYRAGVRAIDEALGTLRAGVGRSALIVFTADHGEAFGEHEVTGHANSLYREAVQVPLIVAWPGGPSGKVSTVTSVRAVLPTLVAMAEPTRAPPGLGPYLCTDPSACRDMPAPMALELRARHLHGLVVGHHHVVRDVLSGDLFAFDLVSDPEELRPLRPPPTAATEALVAWEETAFGADGDACVWPYRGTP